MSDFSDALVTGREETIVPLSHLSRETREGTQQRRLLVLTVPDHAPLLQRVKMPRALGVVTEQDAESRVRATKRQAGGRRP